MFPVCGICGDGAQEIDVFACLYFGTLGNRCQFKKKIEVKLYSKNIKDSRRNTEINNIYHDKQGVAEDLVTSGYS